MGTLYGDIMLLGCLFTCWGGDEVVGACGGGACCESKGGVTRRGKAKAASRAEVRHSIPELVCSLLFPLSGRLTFAHHREESRRSRLDGALSPPRCCLKRLALSVPPCVTPQCFYATLLYASLRYTALLYVTLPSASASHTLSSMYTLAWF